jgi:glyoxylase-like metal-dependent hydrolase (beta-lactamase superfamily II)
MRNSLTVGDFEITWLRGGRFELDGGSMFGVVPKVLWTKKIAADADNYIPLTASPLLIKTPDALVLIDSGLGNKLDDKQKKIFHLREEWQVPSDLASLGIQREDIDFVVLSHFDWDHAGGIVMKHSGGTLSLTFPRAQHVVQKTEWDDVLSPTIRSKHTYWSVNYELLRESGRLMPVDGTHEIVKGVKVVPTGGHTRGHQIVVLESGGQKALHMADLLPLHTHFNPLWVMAYDNYPMDVIHQKELLIKDAVKERAWFTFYHDPSVLACRFDEKGEVIERWA